MALVFHRWLRIPLWALALFTVALTAPAPATFTVLGIAVMALIMPGLVRWLRASPSGVQCLLTGKRRTRSAATAVVAGACVRTLDRPSRPTAEDALDLVRMDDDGGWQIAQPPA